MKIYSVTDLMLIPELSHLRQLDFIDPANTELLKPFLKILGYDLDYPIQFIPSRHRNLQGQVVISYQIVGDIECNESFLNSVWCTSEDRMIVAGYNDLTISEDMAAAMTACRPYGDTGAHDDGFPLDQCEPDEKETLDQIKQLEELLLQIRGNPYRKDGSMATLDQFGVYEKPDKVRRKPEKKLAKY